MAPNTSIEPVPTVGCWGRAGTGGEHVDVLLDALIGVIGVGVGEPAPVGGGSTSGSGLRFRISQAGKTKSRNKNKKVKSGA